MSDKKLKWEILKQEKVFETAVADIYLQKERQANGQIGDYIGIDAPKWVLIIAKKDDKFIMVKQFRHAYQDISIEFPGGVVDKDEEPLHAAIRELKEETGYTANKMTLLAELSPNPAIMKNRCYFFYTEDLSNQEEQDLDSDEYVSILEIPINDVINSIGKKEYVHAFLATGVMLYLRYKKEIG